MVELKGIGIPTEFIVTDNYVCMTLEVIKESYIYYEYYVRDLSDNFAFEFVFGSLDNNKNLPLRAIENFKEWHEDEICSDIN